MEDKDYFKEIEKTFKKDSEDAMNKYDYIVIWDITNQCVIKKYKDGTKVKFDNWKK